MPQLLLEILTEEIPARMQARAAEDLKKLLTEALTEAGFLFEGMGTFAGPRRLVAVAEGVPARSPDVREERKGPRVGAPEKAVEGFLRSAGLASLDQCQTKDDGKGAFYVAMIERPGRNLGEVLAEAIPKLIRGFPWPKSMRWGAGTLRWVRPISRLLCTFDGEVVPVSVEGIESGDLTEGHRVMGRGPFRVRRFEDYADTLRTRGHVMLDAGERRETILHDARTLCAARGLELVEDEGLLLEVAGLVEWPVVIVGDMDPGFLDLPPEVIRLTMRTHQKYFAVRNPATGDLAPHFVTVANQIAPDGGKAIAAGNARVLSARLNDARYFYDTDLAKSLDAHAEGLKSIVFHQKLGTMADKVNRVAHLARHLAPMLGADPDLAERAARLCKADLTTGMVGEFPELQGVMGRYYALAGGAAASGGISGAAQREAMRRRPGTHDGGDDLGTEPSPGSAPDPADAVSRAGRDDTVAAIADAIRDHYRPQGPSDSVPSAPVSAAVALADKLDTLVGFWSIGEKPTGSGDPYALRRAALGVVRIALGAGSALPSPPAGGRGVGGDGRGAAEVRDRVRLPLRPIIGAAGGDAVAPDLLAFIADRLKVQLREEGKRHDLVAAVFALGEDDLVSIVRRVEALGDFLSTDDGANLLAGVKRASNILKKEEERDAARYAGAPDPALFSTPEEQALYDRIVTARRDVVSAMQQEDFAGAMRAVAPLRQPVDAFFETVVVNADDAAVRRNRLLLLSQIRDAVSGLADFGAIEG